MAYGFNGYDTYMPRQQFQPYQMQPQFQSQQPQSDFVTRQEFEELKGMILNGKQSVRKSKSATPASTTAEPEE